MPSTDRDIHICIAEATHNHFFGSTVAAVHRLQSRAVDLAFSRAPGSFQLAAQQHQLIVDAIRAGRAAAAAEAMSAHIQTVRATYQQEMRRLLSGDPGAE